MGSTVFPEIIQLAIVFGWLPAGVLAISGEPEDARPTTETDRIQSYLSGYRQMSAEDAQAMASALRRAVQDLRRFLHRAAAPVEHDPFGLEGGDSKQIEFETRLREDREYAAQLALFGGRSAVKFVEMFACLLEEGELWVLTVD